MVLAHGTHAVRQFRRRSITCQYDNDRLGLIQPNEQEIFIVRATQEVE